MVIRCNKADCTQAAQYRYQCGEGHEGAEWVWGWALCPNHLIAELDVYRQEVAEMRDYGDVGETAPKVAITPITAE